MRNFNKSINVLLRELKRRRLRLLKFRKSLRRLRIPKDRKGHPLGLAGLYQDWRNPLPKASETLSDLDLNQTLSDLPQLPSLENPADL